MSAGSTWALSVSGGVDGIRDGVDLGGVGLFSWDMAFLRREGESW